MSNNYFKQMMGISLPLDQADEIRKRLAPLYEEIQRIAQEYKDYSPIVYGINWQEDKEQNEQ